MRDNAMQSVILWLGGIPLVSLMMKFLLVTTYSGLKKFLFLFSFFFFFFSFFSFFIRRKRLLYLLRDKVFKHYLAVPLGFAL